MGLGACEALSELWKANGRDAVTQEEWAGPSGIGFWISAIGRVWHQE